MEVNVPGAGIIGIGKAAPAAGAGKALGIRLLTLLDAAITFVMVGTAGLMAGFVMTGATGVTDGLIILTRGGAAGLGGNMAGAGG